MASRQPKAAPIAKAVWIGASTSFRRFSNIDIIDIMPLEVLTSVGQSRCTVRDGKAAAQRDCNLQDLLIVEVIDPKIKEFVDRYQPPAINHHEEV